MFPLLHSQGEGGGRKASSSYKRLVASFFRTFSIIAMPFSKRGGWKFASYMFAKIKLLLTGFSFDVNINL